MIATTREGPDFPLFRDRFLRRDSDAGQGSGAGQALTSRRGLGKPGSGKSLKVLDLRALPRDDGPPTELRARKDKLAFFDRQCTRVADGLFVGGETVAKSRELLAASAITHVINCVGFLYPAYFEDELSYKVLYLQDTPAEDILCVLYDVFDFIEAAADGHVLVHCSQGVSRSTALVIAYLMWKTNRGYDDVFSQVKAHRGVANPNIGFICQLLQWHKRRHSAVDRPRVYRVAPQSASVPHYLVPKPISGAAGPGSLDPRGAFVVHTESAVYVWEGARCPEGFGAAAVRFAQQLAKYEGAQGPVVLLSQGQEPAAFWESMALPPEGPAASPRENVTYDKDFELYQRAIGGAGASGGADSGADSARGGRKTPRDEEERGQAHSPNERLRKQARSGMGGGGGSNGSGEEAGSSKGVAGAAAAAPPPPRGVEDVTTQELERGISLDSAAKELEARERRVRRSSSAQPSRLQRASSEEVTLPSLLLTPRTAAAESDEDGEEATSGCRHALPPPARSPVARSPAGARPAGLPMPRPAVPPINLKLKLPGR